MLTNKQLASAKTYNSWASTHVFFDGLPSSFLESLGTLEDADPSSWGFARGVGAFQQAQDLKADGKLGTRTFGKINEVYKTGRHVLLTAEAKSQIVQYTVKFEGGKGKNPYAGCNLDYEFKGRFDRPRKTPIAERTKRHRASKYNSNGGFHIGLSFGGWQAAQEPGSLGTLLKTMYRSSPRLFMQVFGEHWEDLLEVTCARNRRVGPRSARTQPVGGADLWEKVWVKRFKDSATYEIFREAQRQWVASEYLNKSLKTAEKYNLDSRGDLAVLFDIAIQFGVGGMRKRVKRALSPGQEWHQGNILKVIAQLPRARQRRRRHILESAGSSVRYTW